jgi:YD repeat-containing protein
LSIWRSYYDGELFAYKDEYAYNPNGTPLYERFYDWKDGEWILYSDMTYQYDSNGMLTGGSVYSLDMGGATIPLTVSGTPENLELSITINGIIYAKFVLHYDPVAMKLLGREYFEIDEETGALEPDGVDEYTYDTAGRLLTELWYWNDDFADKTEYVYDAAGRKLSVTDSRIESMAGPFVVYGRAEYEYAGDRLERIKWYYSEYEDDSNPSSNFALREITVFYYGGSTGNGQVTLAGVSVYPNPATDVLTVSGIQAGATLTITGLSGSAVLRKTLTDTQTTLSVSSLPSGLYFVTVRSGKGTATFKIIKK